MPTSSSCWASDRPAKRIAYRIVIVLTIIGGILVAAGIIGGFADDNCFTQYNACRDHSPTEDCMIKYDALCHLKTYNALIIVGAIVWTFGMAFCIWFCCCTSHTEEDQGQVALHPLTQGGSSQYATTTTYPPQPPTAMPSSQAYGEPAPGYPVLSYPQQGIMAPAPYPHQGGAAPPYATYGGPLGAYGTPSHHPGVATAAAGAGGGGGGGSWAASGANGSPPGHAGWPQSASSAQSPLQPQQAFAQQPVPFHQPELVIATISLAAPTSASPAPPHPPQQAPAHGTPAEGHVGTAGGDGAKP